MTEPSPQLFVLSAAGQDELTSGLDVLERSLAGTEPFTDVARRWFETNRAGAAGQPLALALLARTREEMAREIRFARLGLGNAFAKGTEWRTPGGSCFAPQPLGGAGVAFVYPGAGSVYPGFGRGLLAAFPGLLRDFEAGLPAGASWHLHSRQLYAFSSQEENTADAEMRLAADASTQITAGQMFGILLTRLMRGLFGVKADAAFGYCTGEAAMLASFGVWPDLETLHQRWLTAPVFRNRIFNEMDSVREAWGLGMGERPADLWRTFVAVVEPERAAAALAGEDRAYLTIVNSPKEVVIAGEAAACERVLARLGAKALPMPFNVPNHCPVLAGEHAALMAVHADLTVRPQPSVTFFSGKGPVAQTGSDLARTVADTYTGAVDFRALVEGVYAAGPRIFVELGARRMCCSWIDDTLEGRPHAAIPLDVKGAPFKTTLARAVARLIAHRVPVEPAPLFDPHFQDS